LDNSRTYAFDSANDLNQGGLLIRGALYGPANRIDLTDHVGTVATTFFGINTANAAVGINTVGAWVRTLLNQAFDNLFECV
jgi:hypothetical protein